MNAKEIVNRALMDAAGGERELRIAALEDEIDRLRAALKPFAEAAVDTEGYADDHALGCDPQMPLSITIGDGRAFAPLKVLHLRVAQRVLGQETTGK